MKFGLTKCAGRSIRLIVLLIVLCSLNGNARHSELKFDHLTIKDGLSQSSVYSILQDSRGFMWFGTRAGGLNRYDAYSFTVFKYHSEDQFSISGNQVISLAEDKDGNIWAGTRQDGLNRFDVKTEKFYRYRFSESDSTSISNNTVNTIYLDKSGKLWVGTNSGLCLYDRENDNFIRYDASKDLTLEDTRAIVESDDGLFWLGGKTGLALYDPQKNKTLATFGHDENNPSSLSESQIETLVEDRMGRVWVGTRSGGLNCLTDREKGTFIRYRHDPNNKNSISSDVVRTLHEDRKGVIWIGTKKALEQLNPDQQESSNPIFIHHVRVEGDEHSISQNSVFSFYADRQENFWIGFYSEGISYLYNGGQKFHHYKNNIFDPYSLSNNMVSSFEVTEAGIWIGTQGGGLNLLDRTNGTFTHFRMDTNKPGRLTSDNIRTLFVDSDGDLWVGTYNGVHFYNKTINRFDHYLNDLNIYTIKEGLKGEIWIGSTESLIRLNKSTKKIKIYTNNKSDTRSMNSNSVNTIYRDKQNGLWIGTKFGLNYYDRANDNFIQYNHEKDNPTTLSDPNVTSICEDLEGTLWIGTLDGLNKFDSVKKSFQRFGAEQGLPSSIISNLISDHRGYLWLTTVRGLSKLDPKATLDSVFSPSNFILKTYDSEDGLQDVDFLQNSAFRSERGDLFLGGINGFNIFNPDSLTDNTHIPEVYITDFKLFNKSVVPDDENSPLKNKIWLTNKIELNHKQSFITFNFVALNYTLSQKNRFSYMMEGFDKEWNYVEGKREALYTNLRPGSYVFKVKASNNDGVWNEQGTSIKIIVHPPWWETLWFRILGVLSLLGIVVVGHRIRLASLQKQKTTLQQKVKERTIELEKAESELKIKNQEILAQNSNLRIQKEEIGLQARELELQKKILEETNASKDKFFSILAHDLKNPFSTMIGFLEVLRDDYYELNEDEKIEMIGIAHDSANLILNLIENLLLWSRSQRGLMPCQPSKLDVVTLIEKELSLLKTMIEKKGIALKLRYQQPKMEIQADENMLSMVVRNLVSNAVKFTNQNGEIKIDVKNTGEAALFEISDSGIGIPKDVADRLFHLNTNFSRLGTANEKGTGLGLVLCQEFVNVHHGKIWVESEEGRGASFYFTIPLN
ncbi:two-component regulator propeller domain-containing protein [Mangrovibacterium sp.]|uniref:sensor histidine kinase n=1 Tax=Mangrovibacterium sp. TaxID=1961364 RepID=UPI0035698294